MKILRKGIWTFLDNYKKELKKFKMIHREPLDTIFSFFKSFSGGKILCPTTYEIWISKINRPILFNKQFGQLLFTITNNDIVSSLINTCKTNLIFCKNKKGNHIILRKNKYLKKEKKIFVHKL